MAVSRISVNGVIPWMSVILRGMASDGFLALDHDNRRRVVIECDDVLGLCLATSSCCIVGEGAVLGLPSRFFEQVFNFIYRFNVTLRENETEWIFPYRATHLPERKALCVLLYRHEPSIA